MDGTSEDLYERDFYAWTRRFGEGETAALLPRRNPYALVEVIRD